MEPLFVLFGCLTDTNPKESLFFLTERLVMADYAKLLSLTRTGKCRQTTPVVTEKMKCMLKPFSKNKTSGIYLMHDFINF